MVMKFLSLLVLAMGLAFGLYACDKKDDDKKVGVEVLKAFEQKFPQAVQVDWDVEGRYCVAEFKDALPAIGELSTDGIPANTLFEFEAWFDNSANWLMTVIDVPYKILPQSVKQGFTTSNYGAWKVEDADLIQRNGVDNIYIIEVEQNDKERYLYFNKDGKLIQEKKSDFRAELLRGTL